MKKLLSIFMILLCFIPIFAQEEKSSELENKEFSISLLNEKYLLQNTKFFANASFTTPNGKLITHNEATKMLLEVPSNKKIIKEYRGWCAATFTLLGIVSAGILTSVAYEYLPNDFLPDPEIIIPITYGMILGATPAALFTGAVAGFKYRVAVDNYNLNLLNIE